MNIDIEDFGAYLDIDKDNSVLDGRFTSKELRLIADEMDRLVEEDVKKWKYYL